MTMKRRMMFVGIIVVLITLVMAMGFGCQRKPAVPTEEAAEITAAETTATEQEELKEEIAGLKQEVEDKDKEIEEMQEKLQKIDSLFTSGAIQNLFSINGTVKEISGRNLTLMGYGFANFVVSISQEAKIFTEYILPEGAPEEEVYGRTYFNDKEIKTGRKEISFEEIKVEDDIYIILNLKPDYTVEGTEVQVHPRDLFNQ